MLPTHDPTATVNSSQPQQQEEQQHEEQRQQRRLDGQGPFQTTNGQSFGSYPPATVNYHDVVQSSDLFWEKLKAFHNSFGSKFMVPTVGGKALDLHHLFVEVTSRGGLEKVIRDRRWKEVISAFNFPATITSASFILRKYYLSLLYHFEQVYHFHKEVPAVSMLGNGNLVDGPTTPDEGTTMSQMSVAGNTELQLGCSVTGSIDGKFDDGYLITVNLGSGQLKGVLYHIPDALHEQGNTQTSEVPSRRHRRRSRLSLHDPSRPRSNRSGYNFFFAEHYGRLKPLHRGQEKIITKKIGHMWNNLTGAEKQVYQEKGLKDKERYKTEMLEYRNSYVQHV